MCELLASHTPFDNISRIGMSCEPIETMSICFMHDRSSPSMMDTYASMNILENLVGLLLRDATHKHPRLSSLIELVIDDSIDLGSTHDLSS